MLCVCVFVMKVSLRAPDELALELATQHRVFAVITQRFGTVKGAAVKSALLSLLYALLYGKNGAFACCAFSASLLNSSPETLHASFAEGQVIPLCVNIAKVPAEATDTVALAIGILRNHAGNYRTRICVLCVVCVLHCIVCICWCFVLSVLCIACRCR